MGTCMILRAKVDKVMTKLKVPARIVNESVANGLVMYKQYDVVFCNRNLVPNFKLEEGDTVKIIGLEKVTSLNEIEERFRASGLMDSKE